MIGDKKKMPEEIVSAHDSVLAELYAKRDEIDTAISANLFLKGSGATAPETSVRRVASGNGLAIPPNAFFGLGIGDAAKKYLEMIQAKRTLAQITKALEDGGMHPQRPNTVYAALRRRESVTGDITRVGDEWGLKEWFSNIAKPKAARKAKTKKAQKKSPSKKAGKASAANAKPTAAPELKIVKPPEQETDTTNQTSGKEISQVDAVHEILEKAEKPLHAKVLVERLKADYGKETNVKSIAASLPQDGTKRFRNITGNTWVLEKWPESKKVKEEKAPPTSAATA